MTEIEFPHSHWCTDRDEMPANAHENIDGYFPLSFFHCSLKEKKKYKKMSFIANISSALSRLEKKMSQSYTFLNLSTPKIHLALARDILKIDKQLSELLEKYMQVISVSRQYPICKGDEKEIEYLD